MRTIHIALKDFLHFIRLRPLVFCILLLGLILSNITLQTTFYSFQRTVARTDFDLPAHTYYMMDIQNNPGVHALFEELLHHEELPEVQRADFCYPEEEVSGIYLRESYENVLARIDEGRFFSEEDYSAAARKVIINVGAVHYGNKLSILGEETDLGGEPFVVSGSGIFGLHAMELERRLHALPHYIPYTTYFELGYPCTDFEVVFESPPNGEQTALVNRMIEEYLPDQAYTQPRSPEANAAEGYGAHDLAGYAQVLFMVGIAFINIAGVFFYWFRANGRVYRVYHLCGVTRARTYLLMWLSVLLFNLTALLLSITADLLLQPLLISIYSIYKGPGGVDYLLYGGIVFLISWLLLHFGMMKAAKISGQNTTLE
ncbi:MAG: ABC transporter permease [Christensenellales bacterium]|jgi:hypothetical protein